MITRCDHFDLSQRNTFGMKVSCRLYVEVTEPEDLLTLDFDALPQPVFVMGGGSNLLFTRDFPGTVLHMGNGFVHPSGGWNEASVLVTLGAGVVFDDFCARAASDGLWGPENLSLIPGEVGASAVQNIGAYGVEAKDLIDTVHAFDRTTRTFVDLPGADCGYGYRTSNFKTVWKGRYIVTAVTFRLSAVPRPRLDYGGVRKALSACGEAALTPQIVRDAIIGIRRQKLPAVEELGSAGSFFCNPVISREHFERVMATARQDLVPAGEVPHYVVEDGVKVPAAWLIDQCGLKGRRRGGAQVYPRQPLVIVNASRTASPEDVLGLEAEVIQAVKEKFGILLHPEVEHV